jgi:acyl-CoA thioesterase
MTETSFFDAETAVTAVGPGRWSAFIGADWNINLNPNGGYAQAPLFRAMGAEVSDHGDPVAATTHFLRPAVAGCDAEITVELLRAGRRTSTVRGTMSQQGKVRLESIATFADLGAQASTEWGLDIPAPAIASPQECLDRSTILQDVDLPLMSRVEVRIDPDSTNPDGAGSPDGVGGGGAKGAAVVNGWMRFRDDRPADSLALTLMADCFPPSVFNVFGRVGWVPTIELTVHVRRRPAPGWIQAQFTTADSFGATLIEDGVLWDDTGAVVAQARQLALIAN